MRRQDNRLPSFPFFFREHRSRASYLRFSSRDGIMNEGEGFVTSVLSGEYTVGDVMEELGTAGAYSFFNGGKTDLDVDHTDERVLIDQQAVGDVPYSDDRPELQYKRRSTLGKAFIPVDIVFRDGPYMIGKKSASLLSDGETEAKAESLTGWTAATASAGTVIYDFGVEIMTGNEGIAGEAYLPLAVTGITGGHALIGRAAGIRENLQTSYLGELTEDIEHYTVEPY